MAIIGIDFESFYSKDYSLSKISTQAYVDHPHFEVIGVAVKVDDEPSEWFSGTMEETKVWLDKFDWRNAWVYAHNALFDATILTWRFDIKPKLWLDTLSMARAVHGTEVGGSLAKLAIHYELGEKGTEVVSALGKRRADFTEEELAKYGEYCINDVDLTHGLFLNLAPHFNKTEIMLIDMTVRMHSEPQFILDVPTLLDHLYHTKKRKEELLTASGIAKEDLMSNPKFAEILRTYGVTPPLKISPATGKETYAFAKTDEDMKALLDFPDFDVQAIVAARLGTRSTIEESRTERFIEIAESGGVLPIPLKYYGADVTGRWSGCDGVNMQNLPRTSLIKSAIQAPEGYVIVGADLSNIELRVSLYFSGQTDKLQIIADGMDLYKDFAATAFKVGYDDVTKDQRFVGKTSILGLGFGTGAFKLRESIRAMSGNDIGKKESERIVELYRSEFDQVKSTWSDGTQVLKDMRDNAPSKFGALKLSVVGKQGVLLPSGLYLKYPNLKELETDTGMEWSYASHRGSRRKIYGGKVVQNCIQSLARCIMGEAMVRITKRYKIALTIHDSCYCVVPEDEAQEALDFIIKELCKEPKWMPGIPLGAEGAFGKTLKEAG
ncbi:3'-5' exonuclease domain containing protein [uncultured Caudovirales phage]|uniref:3'-5' exonuclease domain containing protein n=1 Tax=uncultured Caudovirales phage TaxID=2100421 RepID=A0A6J5QDK0_9CAUD|nr:3'-5' exonuclease domain containing protein [uncultured Caudovirales phage]